MTGERKRRFFLGVALTERVRHGLRAFLDQELGGVPPPGRPTSPAGWHVTLRFLGWSTGEQRDRFLGYLQERLTVEPFVLGFDRLGAFPNPRRATVLWLGVERGVVPLSEAAAVAEEAARAAGYAPEERPYHPHVTLARIRPPQDVTELVEHVARFPLTQRVAALTFFESHLRRGGAVYEPVDTIPLGRRASGDESA